MISKFFIQNNNNKFINNISSQNSDELNIFVSPINNDLYKLYHRIKFDACIFSSSLMNNEIFQFISEFHKDIKIFIYHDEMHNSKIILNQIKNSVNNLIEENNIDLLKFCDSNNITNISNIPTHIINDTVFYRQEEVQKNSDEYCLFIDNFTEITKELDSILYPSTNLKIKMYNNKSIKHHQNLGILAESEKNHVLNKAEYFIDIDNYYVDEAIVCGCKIVCMDNISKIKNEKVTKPITYNQFLQNLL